MATGDVTDFTYRAWRLMPAGWCPALPGAAQNAPPPVLNAVLAGMAWGLAQVYAQQQFVEAQARIATAQGGFLDLWANDFFGQNLPRFTYEQDGPYRTRIEYNLTAPRGTVAGMTAMLTELTGAAPLIFEPANAAQVGGYGCLATPAAAGGTLGWGASYTDTTGVIGSLLLPSQVFITCSFPQSGFAVLGNLGGWGQLANAAAGLGYGYGSRAAPVAGGGAFGGVDLNSIPGLVTEAYIYSQIAAWMPAGNIAWTYIT